MADHAHRDRSRGRQRLPVRRRLAQAGGAVQRRPERARAPPSARRSPATCTSSSSPPSRFADLARQQRRRARRGRHARGRPRRRGRRRHGAFDRRRRRARGRMPPAGWSCRATCRWCSRRPWSRSPACSTTMRSSTPSIAASAAIRSASPPSCTPSCWRSSGDEGARRLVARYPAFGVELDDPGILIDIDTADDLESARRERRRPRPAAPPALRRVSALRRASVDQALDVAVADAAVAQRASPSPPGRRGCCRSGRWRCAGSRASARRRPGRCGSGCARSSVKARARDDALRRAAGQPLRVVDAVRHLARPEAPQLVLDARRLDPVGAAAARAALHQREHQAGALGRAAIDPRAHRQRRGASRRRWRAGPRPNRTPGRQISEA